MATQPQHSAPQRATDRPCTALRTTARHRHPPQQKRNGDQSRRERMKEETHRQMSSHPKSGGSHVSRAWSMPVACRSSFSFSVPAHTTSRHQDCSAGQAASMGGGGRAEPVAELEAFAAHAEGIAGRRGRLDDAVIDGQDRRRRNGVRAVRGRDARRPGTTRRAPACARRHR